MSEPKQIDKFNAMKSEDTGINIREKFLILRSITFEK